MLSMHGDLTAWLHAVTGLKLIRTPLIVYSVADQTNDPDLHGQSLEKSVAGRHKLIAI
jgi:hypothetical protein